ncbi:hypothetical protein BSKO_05696 [Bryopsis sp. KO-2023]|nr:hypothetical protein BSKO_05696 [Bryopsis sp. KO-2023]
MGFVAFFGHFLVGTGPLLALYAFFVARKSFVVLLTLASSFFWLTVLLFISVLFRGFTPLPDKAGDHIAALLGAVVIEQLARVLLYRIHQTTVASLSDVALKSGRTLSPSDILYIAAGFGFGQGVSHSLFFFVSLLPLIATDATIYIDSCDEMSYFLVSALTTLGFSLLHTCSTVVFFNGLAERRGLRIGGPPAMHLTASLITVGNFGSSGCVATVPIVLFIGLISMGWCAYICIEKGTQRPGGSGRAILEGNQTRSTDREVDGFS